MKNRFLDSFAELKDTVTYSNLSDLEYKKNTQSHWGTTPCESNYPMAALCSKDFFESVESRRYKSHPWIIDAIKSFPLAGKKTLEIGFGMGTDHLALARQGAELYGIDLTQRHHDITKRRFELYNKHTELTLGDAENLPYEDNFFDFIYSFGVVHHTPNTEKVISEIHRVLKPGGRCWITVYHKNSIYFYWTIVLWGWYLNGNFLNEGLKSRISRIEYPNNNPNLVIRLYKEKEFASLFNRFSSIEPRIEHLTFREIAGYFGILIPPSILRAIGKRYGWYVIVDAVK